MPIDVSLSDSYTSDIVFFVVNNLDGCSRIFFRTQKNLFWNFDTTNQIWIVIIIFRLIWHQTEFSFVLNQPKRYNYNQNLVWLTRFRKYFSVCVAVISNGFVLSCFKFEEKNRRHLRAVSFGPHKAQTENFYFFHSCMTRSLILFL